jgi:nitrate reductase delta subunit
VIAPPELFKLCSLLLQYPSDQLLAARAELGEDAKRLGRGRAASLLREGWGRWATVEPEALRASYVETFDFRRQNSLYLTFHSYGDRRERGMAMIALKQRYEAAGLTLDGEELPDFLPLMLEFAALQPERGAEALIEHREALEVLREALQADRALWGPVVAAASAALPRITRKQRARAERMLAEGPPEESVGVEPFAPPEMMPPALSEDEPLPVRGLSGLES